MRAAALLVFLAGSALAASPTADTLPTEYEVKAAFLYNFAKYVEWPRDPQRAAEPFVVTVLGEDPFGSILDDAFEGKAIDHRRIVLRRVTRTEEVGASQILFISHSEAGQLPGILKQLDRSAILTVGEMDRFAERGGVICFRSDKDRIRLEINLAVAERSGLRISSELLKLARIVGRGGS